MTCDNPKCATCGGTGRILCPWQEPACANCFAPDDDAPCKTIPHGLNDDGACTIPCPVCLPPDPGPPRVGSTRTVPVPDGGPPCGDWTINHHPMHQGRLDVQLCMLRADVWLKIKPLIEGDTIPASDGGGGDDPMYCPECGEQYPLGQNDCDECGVPVHVLEDAYVKLRADLDAANVRVEDAETRVQTAAMEGIRCAGHLQKALARAEKAEADLDAMRLAREKAEAKVERVRAWAEGAKDVSRKTAWGKAYTQHASEILRILDSEVVCHVCGDEQEVADHVFRRRVPCPVCTADKKETTDG